MPNFRNHRVKSEVSSSFQTTEEVELDVLHSQRVVDTTTRVGGRHNFLVDDIEYSAYNNELKRRRKRRLIFILLITAGTTVLLVIVAAIPLLLASRTPIRNDSSGGRGGTKTVMGDDISTKCEPLSRSLENGYIVCNGENVNSTCWTVCLVGYKKEDLLMGSYRCQVNGEWRGEHTSCTPNDCGTPSQSTIAKEVQQCSKPSGICQIPIKNGMLSCSGTSYRHSCKVTCDEQFRRNLSTIVCESVGKWNRIDFGCLPEDPCINSLCNTVNGSCIPVSDSHQAYCRCKAGFAGNGIHCQTDSDLDGFPDAKLPCQEKHCQMDNCPLIPNTGQENSDGDQTGDVCDDDDDNDNATDIFDNCPFNFNPGQDDKDNDTVGDACDNCFSVHNTDQRDTDHDGIGNACEPEGDMDNDGISAKNGDNCPLVPNTGQQDSDGDGVGDLCDNCVNVSNEQQNDTDQNLIGDACDEQADQDQDGVNDNWDNCQAIPNGDQLDCDADKIGDACDTDKDGDGVTNYQDNCPFVSNMDQADIDGDGIGDVCVGDTDGDMVTDYEDDYPLNKFLNRTDFTLYQEVILDDEGEAQAPPKWVVFHKGQEIVQITNGPLTLNVCIRNPGLPLSYTQFGHLDFSGTVYISDAKDDDFVGIAFGYQSNRHFYVCSWKKKTQTYNLPGLPYPRSVGRKGINLMVIDSITGPGVNLRDALWETGNTINQTHMLWYDPGPQWITGIAYRWRLLHDPDSGRIRVRWYERTKLISDSGNIIDKRYRGGRVGMYVFSQMGVYYSALQALYPKITDFALNFGGVDAYADLGAFSDILGQTSSFTLAAWVWITGTNGPVICSLPPIDFGDQTSNLGFLLQSVEDEEDWTLTSIKTPTRGTGPMADHTSGSGIYAYLESSGIARGNRASLETPWFAAGKGCNLFFFYHMYDGSHAGVDMGTLRVEMKTEKQAWFVVFSRGGNQGKSWHKGHVDLSVYKGLVAVRFTAAKGRSYHSDIAIDDVSFSPSCGAATACASSEVLPVFGTEDGTGIHLSVSGGRVQGAAGRSQSIRGNLPFIYNSWTHCAIQYNGKTKQQSLYVNGRLDQALNHVSSLMPRFNLLLGRDGTKNFQGLLDEVQIWSIAVNVPDLYNKPLKRREKGLMRYYKCDDGEGNTLQDSGPLKRHGSMHGVQFLSSSLELGKQE